MEVTGHDLEGTGDIDLQSRDSLECTLPANSFFYIVYIPRTQSGNGVAHSEPALSISMNAIKVNSLNAIKVNSRQACLEAHLLGDSRSYQLALTLMPTTPNKQM